MRLVLSRRPSPALVIAVIALFVALGGSGYAAVAINGKDIKNRSVAAKKLKKDTLTGREVRETALGKVRLAGEAGRARSADSANIANAARSAGSANRADSAAHADTANTASALGGLPASAFQRAVRWALVRGDGTIVEQSGGITNIPTAAVGKSKLDFGSSVAGKLILASPGLADDTTARGATIAGPCTAGDVGCPSPPNPNHVRVFTLNTEGTGTENHAFYVAVIG